MRLAVIYNDKDIYVEIPTDKFVAGLVEYHKTHKNIKKAFSELEKDIKRMAKDK